MEFTFDKFITYPDSPSIFLQKHPSEADDPFRNPFLSTPDMEDPSIFASDSYPTHSSSPPTSESYSTSRMPFKIIRPKGKQEMKQVALTSKQIKKKEKAKEKAEKKNKEVAMILAKAAKKYIPPALTDPNLDEKTKRQLVQVVKNRMAAQQTRDRRKAEQDEVVEVKTRLEEENQRLNDQNRFLLERVRALEEAQMRILAENEELRRNQMMQQQAAQWNHMPPHAPSQINIDYDNDEKPLAPFEVENSATPMLSRSSRKKNPFGYLFTFTTLLMIMNGLNTTQLQPSGPPGPPPPGNGQPSSPTGHHGDGHRGWGSDDHGTHTSGFGPNNPNSGPPSPEGGDVTIDSLPGGNTGSGGDTSGGDTSGGNTEGGVHTFSTEMVPDSPGGDSGGDTADSNGERHSGRGDAKNNDKSGGPESKEDVHTMSISTLPPEGGEDGFDSNNQNNTNNTNSTENATENDFGSSSAAIVATPEEEQEINSLENNGLGRSGSNRMLASSDPIFISEPADEAIPLKRFVEDVDDKDRGFLAIYPKKKAKEEPAW